MKLYITGILKEAALHAHTRGHERLKLDPKSIDEIQKAVDRMWFSGGRYKLPTGHFFYSPLRDTENSILGYAAFRRVGSNPYRTRLVLSTILSPHMRPKGDNIGNFLTQTIKGEYKPDGFQIKPYHGMPPIPDAKKNS